jgi:acetylornithine/N-succinyldiaminopimelate aminotransferase
MEDDSYFMDTFARTGVVFEKGSGATLWDVKGKKYIDLYGGIAVSALGHAHPGLVKAISDQAAKLIHVCNYFQTEAGNAFARRLCAATGMEKVFLANSGCEANEGAIKLARKYANEKYSGERKFIVCLEKSFHGRTITTLAATGQDSFHKYFDPFTPGFVHVPGNDLGALKKAAASGEIIAFFFEAIQGEGGVNVMDSDYLRGAAEIAKANDILLMFDEIQTGVGRTGTFLACQGLGIKPDIVTIAKGICGGLPAGAFFCDEKLSKVLGKGDHGTTFGGGPLAAAAGNAVLDVVDSPAFLAEVKRKGKKISGAISAWKHPLVKDVRGAGLMIGLQVGVDPHKVMDEALKRGCVVLTAGSDVVRILPPLVISDAEIDEGLALLKLALDACA